jgi:hypothetical protein
MALSQFNRVMQASDIVKQVGVDVGLPTVTDPFTSNDPQYQRLITILNICGNQMLDQYSWARMYRLFTFNTIPNTQVYQLPNDFNNVVPDTLWQPNNTFANGYGSTSPQIWQYVTVVPLVGTITIVYREKQGVFNILPVPQSIYPISFEYESRAWVSTLLPSDENTVFRDNVTSGSMYILHDPTLFMAFLKMKFLEAVGFDTQKATDTFNILLDQRTSKDVSAPRLSMAGNGMFSSGRLLNGLNVPQTDYGF